MCKEDAIKIIRFLHEGNIEITYEELAIWFSANEDDIEDLALQVMNPPIRRISDNQIDKDYVDGKK